MNDVAPAENGVEREAPELREEEVQRGKRKIVMAVTEGVA